MTATTSSAPNQLSLRTKLAFGIGDLGPAMVAAINGFFLNAFLIEVALIPPATAAIIFLLVKIWDSVNDPLIGTLTDRTNTRWGRRRPWLLFGAVPFALAFFLQWLVPDLDPAGKFWYYLIVALLLDTGFTAVNVPYAALTPELTDDYDERTKLNSYRFSFSILGGVLAAFFHSIIVGSYEGEAILQGYMISASIWAVLIVVSNVITFLNTEERFFKEETEAEKLSFKDELKIALSNRTFLHVTLVYFLAWSAIQFVQNNLILYVKYWARGEDQFSFLLLALQFTSFAFLLIWTRVSEKVGRKRVFYFGSAFWMVAGVALFFVPAGQVQLLFFIAPVAAIGVSVCYLIPWSLLPDVVDLDELETGQRREGIFYGFFVFLQKLGISAGLAISNLVLGATGYVAPEYAGAPLIDNQPEAVLLTLRLFVSIVPIIILILAVIAVATFPITKARALEIREELERRRQKA